MKTLYRNLIYILPFLILVSCQDLEEDPRGLLSSSSFYETVDDLDAGVTGIYESFLITNLPQFRGMGGPRMNVPLAGGDDITTLAGGNKADWRQFDQFSKDGSNIAVTWGSWQMPYAAIRAANTFIEASENVVGDELEINQRVAEARFLRGWSYFWLVRVFGEVPVITTSEIDENAELSTVQDLYDLIVEDFSFAEEFLPPFQNRVSRPTNIAAKAFLSKVYLTMAGWPLKQTDKYEMARAKSLEVINSGAHDLYPDFGALWDLINDQDDEFIFSFEFCALTDCGAGRYSSTFGTRAARPAVANGGGFNDYFSEIRFFEKFPEGPRKDATFLTEVQRPDGTILSWEDFNTGHPHINKFSDGSIPGSPTYEGHPALSSRDRPLMRYAEILLIYAEAQAMSAGSPDATAYDAVNQVRRRALGLDTMTPDTTADLPIGLSTQAFQDSVVTERGWELMGELKRWFDLTRLEKVAEANADKDPRDLQPLGSLGVENYYAPIPVEEVLRNPNLGN